MSSSIDNDFISLHSPPLFSDVSPLQPSPDVPDDNKGDDSSSSSSYMSSSSDNDSSSSDEDDDGGKEDKKKQESDSDGDAEPVRKIVKQSPSSGKQMPCFFVFVCQK